MGKVIGDLSSRGGKILGMDTDGNFQVVRAQVAARELYRYSTQLRSLTGGRGLHSEEFSHYQELPAELEQKVIEAAKKARKEEVRRCNQCGCGRSGPSGSDANICQPSPLSSTRLAIKRARQT